MEAVQSVLASERDGVVADYYVDTVVFVVCVEFPSAGRPWPGRGRWTGEEGCAVSRALLYRGQKKVL